VVAPDDFVVRVADDDIADLHRRLENTRFIDRLAGADWRSGVPVGHLREMVEHWRWRFDWRSVERRINGFVNRRVDVGGTRIHCLKRAGTGPAPVPILLVHGWPSSAVELLDLADELADPDRNGGSPSDSFDVVIASPHGFGFSDPPPREDWRTPDDHGRALAAAMTAMGYERFAVHTHDVGASMLRVVLLEQPSRIIGYHTTEAGIPGPHPAPDRASLGSEEREYLEYADMWEKDEGGYFAMLRTRPQTIGHALNDSPAGLAAWILEKWWSWTIPAQSGRTLSDFLTPDQVLANVAFYWHTRSINSADRIYYGRRASRSSGEQARVPVGVARTTQQIERCPRTWAERFFPDIRTWTELGKGGHFVALEQPRLLATAIRDFIRPLRS
jgi:pimeloyl-ACP methyl ester carboxylesterase